MDASTKQVIVIEEHAPKGDSHRRPSRRLGHQGELPATPSPCRIFHNYTTTCLPRMVSPRPHLCGRGIGALAPNCDHGGRRHQRRFLSPPVATLLARGHRVTAIVGHPWSARLPLDRNPRLTVVAGDPLTLPLPTGIGAIVRSCPLPAPGVRDEIWYGTMSATARLMAMRVMPARPRLSLKPSIWRYQAVVETTPIVNPESYGVTNRAK